MEELAEILAELAALEHDENDGSEESTYDESVVARAVSMAEALLVDEGSITGACQLLRHSVAISYKYNVLNESTLKAWKLISRLIPNVHVLEPPELQQFFGDVCTLLETYCAEGLDVLNLPDGVNGDINMFVDQQKMPIKLLGFFTQRVCELLTHVGHLLESSQLQSCWALLLRFHGALAVIGMHTSVFTTLMSESAQRIASLVSPTQGPPKWDSMLCAVLQQSGAGEYEASFGLCALSISMLDGVLESGVWSDPSVAQHCAVCCICALERFAVQHTGKVDDAVAVGLLSEMACALAAFIAMTDSVDAVQAIMVFLVSLACGDASSKVRGALARTLLVGVLASFAEEDQCSLVKCVWAAILSAATTCREGPAAALQCLRAVLLAVEDGSSSWLLRKIVTSCGSVPEDGREAGVEAGNVGILTAAVAEALVGAIPVTHLMCRDGWATQQIVKQLVAQSARTIEQLGGEAGGGEGASEGLSVGCAVTVMRAVAGRDDGTIVSSGAAQSAVHARTIGIITNNASLGTTLLRWISSLSEHARTLLCSFAQGSAGPINLHRVSRVQTLVRTLTTLIACFWSHKLPRAVQQIVGKSVVCCLAAANTLVEQGGQLRNQPAQELVGETVLALMQYASLGLRIISAGNVVDKSIEIAKEISGLWTTAALTAVRSHHLPQPWRYLVLLLASLQSFANSLPAAMKARARELVAAELVPVIQARATGRTYSLCHQQNVQDIAENTIVDVVAACGLLCTEEQLCAMLLLPAIHSTAPPGALVGVKRGRPPQETGYGTEEKDSGDDSGAESESKLPRADS